MKLAFLLLGLIALVTSTPRNNNRVLEQLGHRTLTDVFRQERNDAASSQAGWSPTKTQYRFLQDQPGNIIDEVKKLKLNTLANLTDLAGLTQMAMYNILTVMCPTDDAFKKLPAGVLKFLQNNQTALQELLMYHAIPDQFVLSDGIVNEELLASTDDMLDNIRFNVYPRQTENIITADGAKIIIADHKATNGIIHVIDTVMYPIPRLSALQFFQNSPNMFSILLKAVNVAGFSSQLDGPGPFTLFAPDNNAFKKLPAGALDKLLKNLPQLMDVLEYHVLPQTVYTAGLVNLPYVTAEGNSVTIKKQGDILKVNNATATHADIPVNNGVIYIINEVLMPPHLFN